VDAWVREALGSNLALQANGLAVESGLKAVAEAKALLRPRVSVVASYERSQGGRAVDVPLGDMLRPVYDTLNDLTQAGGNPLRPPENMSYTLTPKREQSTMLQIETPVYDPVANATIRGSKADFETLGADQEVLARVLVRDVRQACYDVLRAQADLVNATRAEQSYRENLRATGELHQQGRTTREPVLRAEAEQLAATQQITERKNGLQQARRYLNFLANQPLDAPAQVELDPMGTAPERFAEQERAELRRADAQIEAARARVAGAVAQRRPTLSLQGRYGVTGEQYSFTRDDDAWVVGLYLTWNVFDFGARRARISKARLTQRRLEVEREHLEAQVTLEARQALDAVETSASAVRSAEARLRAAREAMRIAEGRREVGSLTQLEFFDARRALSDAEAAETTARYRHLGDQAELEFVLAAYPLQAP
jgi:outer membrane protein